MFAVIVCVLIFATGFQLWSRYAIPAGQCGNDDIAILLGNCNGVMFAYFASEAIMVVGVAGLLFSIFGFKRAQK
jgi:cytochrome b subunit of formate dehydrogenase